MKAYAGTRLSQTLNHYGMKQSFLASLLGIEPQNLNNWLRRGSIPADKIPALCEVLRLNPYWLSSGHGAPYDIHCFADEAASLEAISHAIKQPDCTITVAQKRSHPDAYMIIIVRNQTWKETEYHTVDVYAGAITSHVLTLLNGVKTVHIMLDALSYSSIAAGLTSNPELYTLLKKAKKNDKPITPTSSEQLTLQEKLMLDLIRGLDPEQQASLETLINAFKKPLSNKM